MSTIDPAELQDEGEADSTVEGLSGKQPKSLIAVIRRLNDSGYMKKPEIRSLKAAQALVKTERRRGVSLREFILDFQERIRYAKANQIDLGDVAAGCLLMDQCRLDAAQVSLVIAKVNGEMRLNAVAEAIIALFPADDKVPTTTSIPELDTAMTFLEIEVLVPDAEEEQAFFSERRIVPSPGSHGPNTFKSWTSSTKKPWDYSRVKCFECQKLGHIARNCPSKSRRRGANHDSAFETDRSASTIKGDIQYLEFFSPSFWGGNLEPTSAQCAYRDHALLDTGATRDVLGSRWLALYNKSRSALGYPILETEATPTVGFRFGAGECSTHRAVKIPVPLGPDMNFPVWA